MRTYTSIFTACSLLAFASSALAQTAPSQPTAPAPARRRAPTVARTAEPRSTTGHAQITPTATPDAAQTARQVPQDPPAPVTASTQPPATATSATTSATSSASSATAQTPAPIAAPAATTTPTPVAISPAARPQTSVDDDDDVPAQSPQPPSRPAPPLLPSSVTPRTGPVIDDEAPRFLRFQLGAELGVLLRPVDSVRMYARSLTAASFGLWGSMDLQRPESRWQAAAEIGWRIDSLSATYAAVFSTQMTNHYVYAGGSARYAVREWFMPYARATVGSVISLAQVSASQSSVLNGTAPSLSGSLGVGLLLRGRVNSAVGLSVAVEAGGMLLTNSRVVLRENPPDDPMIAQERITTLPVQTGDANLSGAYGRMTFSVSF